MATQQDPFNADALRDWLEALQSKPETPEVIALQRDLLQLLQRTAKQLPEVQALVSAARALDAGDLCERTWQALAEALTPFRVASKND